VERLGYSDRSFPTYCFTCPARVYADGEYYCDPGKLDDRTMFLDIARYRSGGCPKKDKTEISVLPEILLRKVLRK